MTPQNETHTIQHHTPQATDGRTFWGLNATMFQGALSDNVYKLLLSFLLLDQATRVTGSAEEAQKLGSLYVGVIGVAFSLPWIVSVGLAGWMSDRFSKSRVTQWTKILEIGIMVLAVVAFYSGNIWFGVFILFLMSLQSALFSPSKYGILPEILPERRVAWGNGVLQGFTFLSILAGTFLAPKLYYLFKDTLWINGLLLVGLAVAGYGATLIMRNITPANPSEPLRMNPFRVVKEYGGHIRRSVGLRWAAAGIVAFNLVTAMLQIEAVQLIKLSLGISDSMASYALLPIVVGIGAGCFLAGWISRRKNELGVVPFGALGAFIACVAVWVLTPTQSVAEMDPSMMGRLRILVPLAMGIVGLGCGLFIVPIQTFILQESDDRVRGGVWATINLFSACGWLIGGASIPFIVGLRGNPADVFLLGGALMALICLVMCWRFPRIPLRFLVVNILGPFYRIRVRGVENIPESGGALLIANHQSYLDGILIASISDRPVRFIMSDEVYRKWFVYPFAKLTESIPIHSRQSPRDLIKSLRDAADEIRNGGLLMIFPEGQMTRTGVLLPFRRGLERIMKDINAPIVPIAIDGAYDARWALRRGRARFFENIKLRRGKLNVAIGKPVDGQTDIWRLRQLVMDLMVEAYEFRREEAEPLHRVAIERLRRRKFRHQFADHTTDGLVPNWRLLAGLALLGTRLKPQWERDEKVGFLLPPAIGSMLLNIAALIAGKVPVNLNYSASKPILQAISQTAGIRLLITSREFLSKGKLELPEGLDVVYTEDLRRNIGRLEMTIALLRGLFMPAGALERFFGRKQPASIDDLATLVFSSGSTGIPKGIMLSHWNIWANCRATTQTLDTDGDFRLIGALPFFHSFGYMAGLWLPIAEDLSIVFYPNPLDGKAIGMMVEKYKATHLFGTPTFLATYIRRTDPEQFGSLRLVLTGAEKLREYVADGFAERFGIRPIEGFGCTETSPVVTLNTPGIRLPGIFQRTTKHGTIGHPVPGVTVRIVDLNTAEPVPPDHDGMLLVKGHNVMQGYYKMPEKTEEVLRDGWYTTGDIARMDQEGFITITDRLSRFSKIGGEMVPHIRIEEALRQAANSDEMVFAVTGIPDEKRGERLVVLYTIEESEARRASEAISSADFNLPALWIPRWQDFMKVESLPILGSGKMDLKQIKELAVMEMGNRQ